MFCTWKIIKIYYNKLQKKKKSKINLDEKVLLGKKYMQSFFKGIMLTHYISFAPTCEIDEYAFY
jgi:hypothetical protein